MKSLYESMPEILTEKLEGKYFIHGNFRGWIDSFYFSRAEPERLVVRVRMKDGHFDEYVLIDKDSINLPRIFKDWEIFDSEEEAGKQTKKASKSK